ncbi:hypothetical protein MRB53_037705 [Persea americana]|nr:hypothetical protein MRB53_037705 [Persea americana]
MDPLSVVSTALGLAGQAWKVGSQIYQFVHAAGQVDQTVSDLAGEVKAIGDICSSISELKTIDKAIDATLKASIEPQLTQCRSVIDKLDKLVPKKLSGKSFTKQALQQAQLNFRQADIDQYRAQIQKFSSNLQLSLQVLNIKATYLAPQIASTSLLDKLAELDNTMKRHGQKLDDALLRYGDICLLEGQTLYAQSNAGSVKGATVDLQSKSTAEWVSAMQNLQKMQLDADTDAGAEELSHRSVSDLTTSSHQQDSNITGTTNSQLAVKHDLSAKDLLGDDDDEHELTVDLADASFAAGRESFAAGDFEEAEAMFREGLEHLQSLPERVRQTYALDELQLKLATCAYHKKDLDSALAALIGIVERQSSSDSDAAQKLAAGILLAQTYVRLNKLELATSTCENVYRARRRLLGKDSDSCFETLGLLHRVHELSGNTSRAAVYKKMLPIETREQYCQVFATLEATVQFDTAPLNASSAEGSPESPEMSTIDLIDTQSMPPQPIEPSEPELLSFLQFHTKSPPGLGTGNLKSRLHGRMTEEIMASALEPYCRHSMAHGSVGLRSLLLRGDLLSIAMA